MSEDDAHRIQDDVRSERHQFRGVFAKITGIATTDAIKNRYLIPGHWCRRDALGDASDRVDTGNACRRGRRGTR